MKVKIAALAHLIARFAALTRNVLYDVMKRVPPASSNALGLVSTKVVVVCHVQHRAVAFRATSAVLKTYLADTNALDSAVKHARKLIARRAQITRKIESICSK